MKHNIFDGNGPGGNILGFDTSMAACSAALLCVQGGAVREYSRFELRQRGHAEALFPLIQELMVEAGLEFTDLDYIAATQGPGSFTGVRGGVAAARGLALASNVPLYGETSLRVIACAGREQQAEELAGLPLFAVSDARRGQLYVQSFATANTALPAPSMAPQALDISDALNILPAEPCCIIGTGADMLIEASEKQNRSTALHRLNPDFDLPRAIYLARLCANDQQKPDLAARHAKLTPLYLRPPDAKPQRGKQVARRSGAAISGAI